MDFRTCTSLTLLLAFTCIAQTGCSRSEGYVEYGQLAEPEVRESISDDTNATETASIDDPAGIAEPDAVAPDAAADLVPEKVVEESIPEIGSPLEPAIDSEDVAAAPGREIKLLVPEKRFRKEGDAEALRVSYDDIDLLKVLNMEPVPVDAPDHFPAWLQELDGKRIRLRGFMYPTFVAEGIRNFGLARDNGICCFVKQPKIYDMIEVSMADGETTNYIENRPFDVQGIFRIDPDADDTELYQLYRIEDAVVLQ